MLTCIDWVTFFSHLENEKDLFKVIFSYFKTNKRRKLYGDSHLT